MIRVRTTAQEEAAWFASLSSPDVEHALTEAWEEGSSSPEWTLVAEADGRPVARGALVAEPVGGGVETLEGTAAFLWADFDHPRGADGLQAVLDALAERLRPFAPTTLNRRLNAETHGQLHELRWVLSSAGFGLLQEKIGFTWSADLPVPASTSRVRFASAARIGREAYANVMAAATAGTLDRNDRYYVDLCGPRPWADEMLELLVPEDEDSWLVGYDAEDRAVGYVAVGAFDKQGTWTIQHIGVVPEHRGRGYVDDLLAAADGAARARGLTNGLSDVDADNVPMIAAMRRAGHRTDQRPWHISHYQRPVT